MAAKKSAGAKPIRARATRFKVKGVATTLLVDGYPRRRWGRELEPDPPRLWLVLETEKGGISLDLDVSLDGAERFAAEVLEKIRALREAPIDEAWERSAADRAKNEGLLKQWERFQAAEASARGEAR